MNNLPWRELVPVLSINPDIATRDDVARLASERMDLGHVATLVKRFAHKYAQAFDHAEFRYELRRLAEEAEKAGE